MILRWQKEPVTGSVSQGKNTRLLTLQKIFDNHFICCVAKNTFFKQFTDCLQGLISIESNKHSFSSTQTTCLDYLRIDPLRELDIAPGSIQIPKYMITGCRNTLTPHELFGKHLARLKPGSSLGGPNNLLAGTPEKIHNTQFKRMLRTDNCQINMVTLRKLKQPFQRSCFQRKITNLSTNQSCSAIARCNKNFIHPFTFCNRPGKSMLPRAASYNQNIHGFLCRDLPYFNLSALLALWFFGMVC